MRGVLAALLGTALCGAAFAQTAEPDNGGAAVPPPAETRSAPAPASPAAQPAPGTAAEATPAAPADQPPQVSDHAVLVLRALDKITGKPTVLLAPINKPVHFATLTIVARYCYSTPPSETPETSAFLQIEDHRPDQPAKQVFSGWMYASSPGLNGMQHPLYDVWVIHCNTNAPGDVPTVASAAPKPVSPDAGAGEAMPTLPEGAGQ